MHYTIRRSSAFFALSVLFVACGDEQHSPMDDAMAQVSDAVVNCDKFPPPAGCDGGNEDPPPGDAGTPPPPPVYVSYSITNSASTRRFCDVTMVTSTNPTASGSYYYEYLEPGYGYGGYHVNGGAPPYPVEFRVGCWPDRDTPVGERAYTVRSFTLTTSTRLKFANTNTGGVVFVGSEVTQ